jgi:hypothetical protein
MMSRMDEPHGGRLVTAARRHGIALRTLALAALLLGAFFGGVLAERLRFDRQRSDMLRRFDRALREHQEQVMRAEKHSAIPAAPVPR